MKYLYWLFSLMFGISALVYAVRLNVDGVQFSCICCLLCRILLKLEETE